MAHATIEGSSNPWEYMCERWNLYFPPARPSANDVAVYKRMMYRSFEGLEQDRFHVLVLGATPEIREMLAADQRIEVTLVDLTMEMFAAMGELMSESTDREIWVRSSWVGAPLKEQYFDAVISDLVVPNVPYESLGAFYEKVRSLLRPTGHWINRIYFVDDHTRIRTLDELLAEYCAKDEITKRDINNFRSTAGLLAWSQQDKLLDWSVLLEHMNEYRVDGEFVHESPRACELLRGAYDLFKPFDKKFYLDTEEGTLDLLHRYFRTIERVHNESVADLEEKTYYTHDLVGLQSPE